MLVLRPGPSYPGVLARDVLVGSIPVVARLTKLATSGRCMEDEERYDAHTRDIYVWIHGVTRKVGALHVAVPKGERTVLGGKSEYEMCCRHRIP